MKEVITLALAIVVFLVLYIWSIRNYSSFFSVAIYYIIAIILFSIFGGLWGFTLSFLFSILVALTTDDDGEFKKKKDEANNSSQSNLLKDYMKSEVTDYAINSFIKNQIKKAQPVRSIPVVPDAKQSEKDAYIEKLIEDSMLGIFPPTPEPFPPVFCKPTKKFSSSGKEIPSNFDINKISYETVVRIEDLGTPVPAYDIYFKSCRETSKIRVSEESMRCYYVGKITRVLYNGLYLSNNKKHVFQILHPIGSIIYGYVKSQGDGTVICEFPEEDPIDGSDCGMTAFWKCTPDSTFPYYCQKGNIIKAIIDDYVAIMYSGKYPTPTGEFRLELRSLEVTYTTRR